MTSFSTGLWAEKKAQAFFQAQGYRCLAHRWKTKVGEIDLIFEKQQDLVFVEVKKRRLLSGGLHALLPPQKVRILQAAHAFLQAHPLSNWQHIRVDVIVVWGEGRIFHLPNAIEEDFMGFC